MKHTLRLISFSLMIVLLFMNAVGCSNSSPTQIYFQSTYESPLSLYDLDTQTITPVTSTPVSPQWVIEDDSILYAPSFDYDGVLSKIFDADGNYLSTHALVNELHIMNVKDKSTQSLLTPEVSDTISTIFTEEFPEHPLVSFTPIGIVNDTIYFSISFAAPSTSSSWVYLYSMKSDGSNLTRLSQEAYGGWLHTVLTEDTLYFTAVDLGWAMEDLHALDLKTNTLTTIAEESVALDRINNELYILSPRWSEDTVINEIYQVSATNEHTLITTVPELITPDYIFATDTMLYFTDFPYDYELTTPIFCIDLAAKETSALTTSAGEVALPAGSILKAKTDDFIYYTAPTENGSINIYSLDLKTGATTELMQGETLHVIENK